MSSMEGKTAYAEPEYAKPKPEVQVPFFSPSIDKYLTSENSEIFLKYSGIPESKLSSHVHDVWGNVQGTMQMSMLTAEQRDKAWAIRRYPCTGLGVWLVPYISRSPAYPQMVQRLKAGEVFLDLGCFLGVDMRRLAFDGAPSDKMYGVDIVSHWDLGYELYQDKNTFQGHFIEVDMLSREHPELAALEHKVDIISFSAVLHQWSWDDQLEAAKRIIEFSKPGSIIIGYIIGGTEAFETDALGVPTWVHDPGSLGKLFDAAGAATGTKWQTQAWLRSWDYLGWDTSDMGWLGPKRTPLEYVVTRV